MPQKINILHLIKSLGRGGAEMLLPETLKLHDQSKYNFHYIYFLPWKNQMVEAIKSSGGQVTCLAASNNIQILLQARAILKYIRENEIQLIHCHLPWAGFVGRIVFLLSKIPVVYTEHNKQERYHFATRWLNRTSFNWQSAAIAVSNDVADSIQKMIKPKITVHQILNGVNTNHFQRDLELGKKIRDQLNIPDHAIIVGTISVFRFQKRLKEWLDVMAEVLKKRQNVYGLIIGDGPLKEEIINHLNKLNLQKKIILAGLQTDVKPWLSSMDIFMMTSKFEGLPIALLEAMSMQCAIATTDAGGIKEVVNHNQSGLMVGVDDVGKLSEEILRLIDDPEFRNSLGVNARNRVIESFGIEQMVRKLEALYFSLVKKSGT